MKWVNYTYSKLLVYYLILVFSELSSQLGKLYIVGNRWVTATACFRQRCSELIVMPSIFYPITFSFCKVRFLMSKAVDQLQIYSNEIIQFGIPGSNIRTITTPLDGNWSGTPSKKKLLCQIILWYGILSSSAQPQYDQCFWKNQPFLNWLWCYNIQIHNVSTGLVGEKKN